MNQDTQRSRLLEIVAVSARYCALCQQAGEMEKDEFVDSMLGVLPRIYLEFHDLSADGVVTLGEAAYGASYVDEDYYESIRRHIELLMGPEDTFLETFEEDMKYSDTPIAASISESLADIFQPLFNFTQTVNDTDGDQMEEAYLACREDFAAYWAQTLCNVMRALNNVKYNGE